MEKYYIFVAVSNQEKVCESLRQQKGLGKAEPVARES